MYTMIVHTSLFAKWTNKHKYSILLISTHIIVNIWSTDSELRKSKIINNDRHNVSAAFLPIEILCIAAIENTRNRPTHNLPTHKHAKHCHQCQRERSYAPHQKLNQPIFRFVFRINCTLDTARTLTVSFSSLYFRFGCGGGGVEMDWDGMLLL